VNEVPTGQGVAGPQQSFVGADAALLTEGQPAETIPPRQGALDCPPVPAQPPAGLNASAGDAALDAPLTQVSAAVERTVGFIGVESVSPPANVPPRQGGFSGFIGHPKFLPRNGTEPFTLNYPQITQNGLLT
jgi:hypothetical protein